MESAIRGLRGAPAAICRCLDSLPLAIELAAARMSAFDVDQVESRLDDMERRLFDRLSVLVGGCDLDALHHVGRRESTARSP